jgi:hypothetical protein
METSSSKPITKVIIILTERKDLVDLILKWKMETPTSSKLGTNAIIALSIIIFLLIVFIVFVIIRRYKVKNLQNIVQLKEL